jgi:hypothetical protein
MTFAQTQLRQLKRQLNRRSIKHRESNGLTLSYIEGWYAIAEANRIFGFDGWDRETVASQCVWAKPIGTKYGAAYLTRVRITVRAGDQIVVREGSGTGEATAASPGLAHEFAAKAAETDATKRALSTFGNRFGLSLYAGSLEAGAAPKNSRITNEDVRARSATNIGQADAPQAGSSPAANENSADAETTNLPGSMSKAVESRAPSIPPWPNIDPFEEAAARAAQRIDKSKLFRSEVQRLRDPGHLRYVSGLSCLVCARKPVHAHHLRFAQPKALGRKVSDEFTVPLCNLHHRELHTCSDEEAWWEEKKLSPLPIAQELWATSRRHRSATALQTEFLKARLAERKDEGFGADEGSGVTSVANDNELGK